MNNKKQAIALLLLICFSVMCLAGCGTATQVEEITWTNLAYAEEYYDVIVVGTEPEGVSAAVSAARNGMKTLLL